mmetsp:Transcript_20744/g.61340  ORF Transcript_20744/g.61340 Transcript_20744/m.61340 type:complete len:405 (+) Transcript_20744:808-2022(+)
MYVATALALSRSPAPEMPTDRSASTASVAKRVDTDTSPKEVFTTMRGPMVTSPDELAEKAPPTTSSDTPPSLVADTPPRVKLSASPELASKSTDRTARKARSPGLTMMPSSPAPVAAMTISPSALTLPSRSICRASCAFEGEMVPTAREFDRALSVGRPDPRPSSLSLKETTRRVPSASATRSSGPLPGNRPTAPTDMVSAATASAAMDPADAFSETEAPTRATPLEVSALRTAAPTPSPRTASVCSPSRRAAPDEASTDSAIVPISKCVRPDSTYEDAAVLAEMLSAPIAISDLSVLKVRRELVSAPDEEASNERVSDAAPYSEKTSSSWKVTRETLSRSRPAAPSAAVTVATASELLLTSSNGPTCAPAPAPYLSANELATPGRSKVISSSAGPSSTAAAPS